MTRRTSPLFRLAFPLLRVLVRGLFWLYGGYRVEGRQRIPRKGGVLVCPNHISDSDPLAVAAALPRPCWFMAKEELFSMPWVGPIIRFGQAFPVKRWEADRAALKRAEELLEAGEVVVVFPEGQLSETGRLQPLLPGAAMVALRAGVPLVPAGVLGTSEVLPYGKTRPRRSGRPVVVRFGVPLDPAALSSLSRRGQLERLTADLGREIARLSDQEYSHGTGPPPST